MGLVFDCLELSPRRATRHANPGQPLGFAAAPDGELIMLQPGPHLIEALVPESLSGAKRKVLPWLLRSMPHLPQPMARALKRKIAP